MKWNFLYQITAASRTPDHVATAPRSPFSLSSVLNWICWTPPPEQNSWVRHCLCVVNYTPTTNTAETTLSRQFKWRHMQAEGQVVATGEGVLHTEEKIIMGLFVTYFTDYLMHIAVVADVFSYTWGLKNRIMTVNDELTRRGLHSFLQKFRRHLKILGTGMVTWRNFLTGDLKVLVATKKKNSVVRATWHPWVRMCK